MIGARVLILARAPVPGACKRLLEPVLGPDGCARLQAVLIRRAAAWALAVAPGAAHLDYSPADAGEAMTGLAPDGVLVAPQGAGLLGARLADPASDLTSDPLLLAGVDLPGLGHRHAASALGDLEAGWEVSFGPATDGGCYLLGLGDKDARRFGRGIAAWRRRR